MREVKPGDFILKLPIHLMSTGLRPHGAWMGGPGALPVALVAGEKAHEAWLEAPRARLVAPQAWLETPKAWLENL